jgi:hypothetical protein
MENQVRCPYCTGEFHNVHIDSVKVNRDGEITIVDYSGTHMTRGLPAGRGGRIEIIYWCENGHKWIHGIQFHKGSTFTEDHILISNNGGEEFFSYVNDLWRD